MADTMRKLAKRMLRARTIAFVGAGASASVGFPTWDQLIDGLYGQTELGREARRHEKDHDLRWLAEQYASELEGSMVDSVREVFEQFKPGGPGLLHQKLAMLPFNHFATTNYDRLIEEACDLELSNRLGRKLYPGERCLLRSGRNDQQFASFLSMLAEDSDRRAVLHLHGTLEDQLTLTMADFNDQYLHDAMQLRMFAIFATSTVVFIGASMNDPDVMELVRRAHFHSGPSPRHFAFLPDFRRRDGTMLERNFGIQPIFYRWSEAEGHADLVRRLEQLLEYVELGSEQDEAALARGNVRGSHPLVLGPPAPDFEDIVDRVKDEVRRRRQGLATFSGVAPTAAARLVRRIAADYAHLPGSHHFRYVLWVSPRRLGLFPGSSGARGAVDALAGEMTTAFGGHRLTATRDHPKTMQAIGDLLQGQDRVPAETTLLVFDAVDELRSTCSSEERARIRSFLQNLPKGSVALLERGEEIDPMGGERWRAYQSHVSLDDPREGLQVDPSQTWEQIEAQVDAVTDGVQARILAGMSVLATSMPAATLAGILDLQPEAVSDASAELAAVGLLEVEHAKGGIGRPGASGRGSERLDLSSPVRTLVLRADDGPIPSVMYDVIAQLLSWSRATIASLSRWESHGAQLREITEHMPNLLATFEAGCWFSGVRASRGKPLESWFVDPWLWLGTDLAYILPNVGRWSEAFRIVEYLSGHAEAARDTSGYRRELQILNARLFGHQPQSEQELEHAAGLATSAVESAEAELAILKESPELEDTTPVELHRDRARIRLGQTYLGLRKADLATEQFERVYEAAFGAGVERPHGRSLKFAADAAGWLAESRWQQLGIDPAPKDVVEVLRILDTAFLALVELENQRDRGHHARLRGEVLDLIGSRTAARRSFARALIASFEYQDRYLEALARIGLARTDRRRRLARMAERIFTEVFPPGAEWARSIWYDLPPVEPDAVGVRRMGPAVIAFVGLPGSGKSVAVRVAKQVLTEWGLNPDVEHFDPPLIERWRSREGVDADEVRNRFGRHLELPADSRPSVLLARLPTAHPGEVFTAWGDEASPIENILCVHLTAAPEVLKARNRERHAEGVDYRTLIEHVDGAEGALPSGYVTWEAWFEAQRSAYVRLSSDVPVGEFEDAIRRALSLSYLDAETLVRTTP